MMTSKTEDNRKHPNDFRPQNATKSNHDPRTATAQQPSARSFLQRNIGNQHLQNAARYHQRDQISPIIQRKCSCGGTCTSCAAKKGEEKNRIQAKLTVGPANDHYEQEADRVAAQIMRMPDLSRQNEKEKETRQTKIQRMATRSDAGFDPGPDFKISRSGGQALSSATRQFMEPSFGADFSQVRIHNDSAAQQSASQIQAKAFTSGNHIWMGKGASESDKTLMAHELTHVVQQSGTIRRLPCRDGNGEITHTVNILPVIIAEDDGSASTSTCSFNTVKNIWDRCCVNVNVLSTVTENESDYKTLNFTPNVATAEPSALIASYVTADRVPVIFHDLMDPGTGASKNAGTGGAFTRGGRIVFTVDGVAPEVVAHEIGHALGSGHTLGTRADGVDTVMKPSRAYNSANPHNVSQAICDNARGSSFTTAGGTEADCCQILS